MDSSWATSTLSALYVFIMLGMGIFSLQSLVLAVLYLLHRHEHPVRPSPPADWPAVTVQLPIFNERYVVQRLIEAACALDYPSDRLCIQVLDDSTDETTRLARECIAAYRAQGVDIHLLHRGERTGYKAGALAQGLEQAPGEMIAIFDADFVPPPDFLRRMVPYLAADPRVGMVQARWGHLNPGFNPLTRGQALSLDGHFVVIQTARSRSGLLFNFNGSGGVLRRECIDDAGGWQGDTLTEDLDLSYRAQLRGWRLAYVTDVIVPAEIPPLVSAYKQQQHRWACGGMQSLIKLRSDLWHGSLPLHTKLAGYLHLASFLAYPFMLLYLLICLPLALSRGIHLPSLWWLLPAGLGPPLLVMLSQWGIYPDWGKRLAFFPLQALLAVGLGLNNTLAILMAFSRRPAQFYRTPKFNLAQDDGAWRRNPYHLPVDWTVWGELALAGYALITMSFAIKRIPSMVPALVLIALGFAFVGGLGLWQGLRKTTSR